MKKLMFSLGAALSVSGAWAGATAWIYNESSDLAERFKSIGLDKVFKDARCFAFDVMIRQKQGDLFWSEQRIIARGYGRSEKDPKALTSTLYELKSLPEGEATIKVTPVSCFAKLGTPLTLTYKKA